MGDGKTTGRDQMWQRIADGSRLISWVSEHVRLEYHTANTQVVSGTKRNSKRSTKNTILFLYGLVKNTHI